MFVFKYTRTDDDVVQYARSFYKEGNTGKISPLIFSLFLIALGIAVICDAMVFTAAPGWFQIVLHMAGVMLIFFGVRFLASKKNITKQASAQMSKYRQLGALIGDEETEYVFDEDSLTISSSSYKATYTYSSLYGIKVNEGNVYVGIDPTKTVIIPARAFESDEQREEFVKFIEKKIEENKV